MKPIRCFPMIKSARSTISLARQLLTAAPEPGGGAYGGYGDFGGFGGFGDIFESFFGGGSAARRNGPLRGSDIEVTLRITFEEAAFGVKKEVSINRREACEHCHGTGAKPGSGVKTCPTCNGTGQIRQEQRTMFGSFANIATCPTCHGQGKIIEEPCEACRGSGRVQQSRKISVNIPAGIDNGQILTLSGQGEAGERAARLETFWYTFRCAHIRFLRGKAQTCLWKCPLALGRRRWDVNWKCQLWTER